MPMSFTGRLLTAQIAAGPCFFMLPVAKLRKTACHGRVEIKEDIAEGRRVFMKILKEFKEFISKGNVLDTARLLLLS